MSEIQWASAQESVEQFRAETVPVLPYLPELPYALLGLGYRMVDGEIYYSAAWINDGGLTKEI
jgi:hypothetical protein